MFNALHYATLDTQRTGEAEMLTLQRWEEELNRMVGQLILSQEAATADEALVLARPQVERLQKYHHVYTADPDDVYPAVIQYLRDDPEWRLLAAEPDSTLTRFILEGSSNAATAQFILMARQTVMEALHIPTDDWELALAPRSAFTERERGKLKRREAALEVARRFFTEALHQAVGQAILLHLTPRREEWRL